MSYSIQNTETGAWYCKNLATQTYGYWAPSSDRNLMKWDSFSDVRAPMVGKPKCRIFFTPAQTGWEARLRLALKEVPPEGTFEPKEWDFEGEGCLCHLISINGWVCSCRRNCEGGLASG